MAHYLALTLAAAAGLATAVQVALLFRLAVPALRNRVGGPARS